MMIIAHRGASAVAPESTQAAIRAAVRAKASMIELDVQMTRDGRLVVFHDDRLERTTDGRGRLARMPYAEIAGLDAGRWFRPRVAGQRILLVSQVFRLLPSHMRLNLELKRTVRGATLLARLRRLVRRSGMRRRLLISSFDPRLLQSLRRAGLALALLCRAHPERSLAQAVRLGCRAWHPRHTVVTPTRIARAHAAGLRVHVWTVEDVRLARRLSRWGADGIFTNDPARMIQRLGRR